MSKVKSTAPLNDEERKIFATTIFEVRKNNPTITWKDAFDLGRKALPPNRVSKNIDHPKKMPWIIPMLEQLEKDYRKPIVLDEAEREAFARNFLQIKKDNPGCTQTWAIREANKLQPEGRKIGETVVSLTQVPSIKKSVEKVEAEQAKQATPQTSGVSFLTDDEKATFINTVHSLRKGGATWTRAMREANAFLPADRRLSKFTTNPSQVPWLLRGLEKLNEAEKNRVVIDHRGTLPKPEAQSPEYKKERKHSETKTYWNHEEKEFFAEVVYQLKSCNPGWGWQKVLDEANMEMPGHKRRPKMPPAPAAIPWLNPMLDKIAKRPPERREWSPGKIPEVAVQAAPAPTPAMDMQAMMMAAMEKVAREQFQLMGMNPTTMTAAQPQPAKPEPVARKKVVVVGLLPVQTNDIQKRFGHKFDFKFIGSNTPNQQIRDSLKHGDIGILMTRFVSHPTQAAMRDHPGFTFCNGNSTALENLLEEKIAKLGGQ